MTAVATHAAPTRTAQMLQRQGVVIALVLLILFGALRYDNFIDAYNVMSVLRYNAMFALVALGMAFVIMTGGIDLSVGGTAALASAVPALLSDAGLTAALLGRLPPRGLIAPPHPLPTRPLYT